MQQLRDRSPTRCARRAGRSRELYRLVGSAGGSSLSTRLHHFWGPSGGDGGASGGALATTDYSTQALLHSFTGALAGKRVRCHSSCVPESLALRLPLPMQLLQAQHAAACI